MSEGEFKKQMLSACLGDKRVDDVLSGKKRVYLDYLTLTKILDEARKEIWQSWIELRNHQISHVTFEYILWKWFGSAEK